MATAEVAVGLHVSDHGLDCRATPQFAPDEAEDAALLTGDKDATRIGRVVAAIALVDIGVLDRAAGELLGGIDDAAECVPVIRVARQRPGVEHELATGAQALVVTMEALTLNSWGALALPLPMHSTSGAWKE